MTYSHQFLIAFTVESDEPDPDKLSEQVLTAGVAARLEQIILHDGIEAFRHADTAEV
jgi:hypothetical protein